MPAWRPCSWRAARSPRAVGGRQRSDNGEDQLTYQGKPLHTLQLDKAVGDAKGNNLEDDFGGTHLVRHAVTVDGDATPSTADSGGGY